MEDSTGNLIETSDLTLKDTYFTNELKAKDLELHKSKRTRTLGPILAAAISAAAIAIFLVAYQYYYQNNGVLESKSTSHFSTVLVSTPEVEKYWGSSIALPSYIPSGFELTDISVPEDDREKYVKLTYSFNNAYFKITENKSTKYTITGKPISINNINGILTSTETSDKVSEKITQVIFEKDNIQYLIVGNISETELIAIAKSFRNF